jgi:hypothetical protein
VKRTSRLSVETSWQECQPLTIPGAGFQRVWQREVHDGHLSVICGQEPHGSPPVARWHLSISHRTSEVRPRPGRYPHWDEIADARYRFCPAEVTMAMLLPPMAEYVNVHETTFHLHQLAEDEVP